MKATSLKPKSSARLKAFHKKLSPGTSLKAFVRSLSKGEADSSLLELAAQWRFNKLANTSKAQLKIGRTRKRVKSGGGGKKVEP